jgi:sugar/nucleoside kinase (ribokinase family)
MGDFVTDGLAATLRDAREAGLTTSLDVLASTFADEARVALREAMQWVGYSLPNDQQICELYGADDVEVAASVALADGAQTVVVACGAAGCLLAQVDHRIRISAVGVGVVDITGCGDALSAAFIRAKLLGWEDEAAARLGCTAGSLVATALGSDAGIVDLPSLLDWDRGIAAG